MTVPTISPYEAFDARRTGRPWHMLDVRTPAECAERYVPGARQVPLDQLDPRSIASAIGSASNTPLFVICRTGGRAAKAVEQFHAAGFTNAIAVAGGLVAWEQAGLPIVRGTPIAMPLERQVRIAAGSLVLLGVLAGWLIHPALYAVAALVGSGLIFAGVTDWCGMGLLLARMPWNRHTNSTCERAPLAFPEYPNGPN